MSLKFFVFILLLLASSILYANERVALVIGNAAYQDIEILANTINDAKDIAKTLEMLQFKVILKTNLNKKQMGKALNEFEKTLGKDTVGVFYYAGHAVQIGKKNYLLPIDASINSPNDVHFESMQVDRVLSTMGFAKNKVNIIILDACRNNPFKKYRGFQDSSGLSDMKAPEGFLIIHSTTPGKKSADGIGKNGLFTQYLNKNMTIPNRDILFILTKTRNEVIKQSKALGYKQVPWETSSLLAPFCFKSCPLEQSTSYSSTKLIFTPTPPNPPNPPTPPIPPFEKNLPLIEPEMVEITGGVFTMGCDKLICRENDEKPAHQVIISSFYIGKYEVTFAQWDACVKAKACSNKPDDNGWGRDTRPVININWNDTQEFIQWLNSVTGKKYRLPTEAEWEYVAHSETNYPWGDSVDVNRANCDGCGSQWDKQQRTAPVGSFPAYKKLYDIYGNISEWVQDCYHKTYDNAPKDGTAWIINCSKNSNNQIVGILRGGSWWDQPSIVSSTHRYLRVRARRPSMNGFRIAKSK
jgi:formylglycine-generating enzyme required for sulfatase activity